MCFSYCKLPFYHLQKVHKLIMTSARVARGNFGMRVSCNKILDEFKMLNMQQLLFKSALCFITKIIHTKQPSDIYALLKIPTRSCSIIYVRDPPKASSCKFNYLPFLVDIYNKHSCNFKSLPLTLSPPLKITYFGLTNFEAIFGALADNFFIFFKLPPAAITI